MVVLRNFRREECRIVDPQVGNPFLFGCFICSLLLFFKLIHT